MTRKNAVEENLIFAWMFLRRLAPEEAAHKCDVRAFHFQLAQKDTIMTAASYSGQSPSNNVVSSWQALLVKQQRRKLITLGCLASQLLLLGLAASSSLVISTCFQHYYLSWATSTFCTNHTPSSNIFSSIGFSKAWCFFFGNSNSYSGFSSRRRIINKRAESWNTRRKKLSMSSQEEAGTIVEIDCVYLAKEESNSIIHDDNSSLTSTSTPLVQSPPEKCTSFCNRVLERNISDRSKFYRPCNFFDKIFSNRGPQTQNGYSYENVKSSKSSNENIFTKILRGIREHIFVKLFRGVKRSMSKLLRHWWFFIDSSFLLHRIVWRKTKVKRQRCWMIRNNRAQKKYFEH